LRIFDPDNAGIPARPMGQVEQEHRLPRPRAAVFTTDRTSFHEAASFLADLEIDADHVFPRELYPESSAYILDIVDLDHWTVRFVERLRFICDMTDQPLKRTTILHSHLLTLPLIAHLQQHGVIVVRELTPAVLISALGRGSAGKSA
jgi:hypothetical protein